MWGLGGHLGAAVSALVDGQLDEDSAEQAWAHIEHCQHCRALVEREGWVKRRLALMGDVEGAEPPARLLGSLYDLDACAPEPTAAERAETAEAWATVGAIERRGRRRVGLAIAGAGSVGVAVLGLTALSGVMTNPSGGAASLGRGQGATTPRPALVAPAATVHGRLPGWTTRGEEGFARARAVAQRE